MLSCPNRRILYVIGSLERGGDEIHLVRVTRALKARGWQPEVYALDIGGPLTVELQAQDIPIHGIPGKAAAQRTRVDRIRHQLSNVAALMKLMRERKPAVVHFFLPAAYMMGAMAALMTRTGP